MSKRKREASSSASRKKRRTVPHGVAHVKVSFNNTIVTITDTAGNALVASSTGEHGFKGSRQNTPHAGQLTAASAAKKAVDLHGMQTCDVKVNGFGSARDASVRGVGGTLKVKSIEDVTPVRHNGTRPRKERRV